MNAATNDGAHSICVEVWLSQLFSPNEVPSVRERTPWPARESICYSIAPQRYLWGSKSLGAVVSAWNSDDRSGFDSFLRDLPRSVDGQ